MKKGGKRIGFKFITLPEKKEFILSSINPPGIPFSKYYVKKDNIAKAIKKLNTNADFFLIDEVGPMELKHKNFLPEVKKTIKNHNNYIIVLHRRMIHLSGNNQIYTLTVNNREQIFKKLKKKMDVCSQSAK